MISHNGKALFHGPLDRLYAATDFIHVVRATEKHFGKNKKRNLSLWRLKIPLTGDRLDRPFASKDFSIHVREKLSISIKTWNEGAKVDAKLDFQIPI